SLDGSPFSKSIVKAMKDAGFTSPSPIQSQAWPIASAGYDMVAVAKTGSGKTLGFLLPAFSYLEKLGGGGGRGCKVLVLAPTRELAIQIESECKKFGKEAQATCCCLYGGVPVGPQKAAMKQDPKIVIATPGRLVDLMSQDSCDISKCGYVVLDEADRMLDMGFEPQIKKVFDALPAVEARQTLFFTATWPKAVRKMAGKFLKEDLFQIFVDGGEDAELSANKAVKQRFVHATDDEKDAKLWKILVELPENARVVCFANTKRRVDYLSKQQQDRDKALAQFVKGEAPLMIATDVAARGLDIKGVTHVINFDMARDVESYVHRIGRTGRAGELGESITFWNPDYDKECAPALIKIAKDAGQEVPDWLLKFEKVKTNKSWKVEDAVLN
ncbi:hypothetical protein GUITHDRAFT_71226, partial [Guillardia theta CCMP2712]